MLDRRLEKRFWDVALFLPFRSNQARQTATRAACEGGESLDSMSDCCTTSNVQYTAAKND
jgi:hypothetical protein